MLIPTINQTNKAALAVRCGARLLAGILPYGQCTARLSIL